MCSPWSQPLACWGDGNKGASNPKDTHSANSPSVQRIAHVPILACVVTVPTYPVWGRDSALAPATPQHLAPCPADSLMLLNEFKSCNEELVFCLQILMLRLCSTFQNPENHPDGIHLNKKRKKTPLVNS